MRPIPGTRKTGRYSHTYFECSTTSRLLKDSGMIRELKSFTVITASPWVQWFMEPKIQYQIMGFYRAIYYTNHDYGFNTQYSTPRTKIYNHASLCGRMQSKAKTRFLSVSSKLSSCSFIKITDNRTKVLTCAGFFIVRF
jgi:hypothetical protein